jgi:UDP-glucose 4-epimerase
VVNAFNTVLGRSLPTRDMPRRAGDPPALACDASRLKNDLGWTPRHASIGKIVETALAWERHQRSTASA